jgi:hypothetical protein
LPPSITETQLLVVPKSIPITFAIFSPQSPIILGAHQFFDEHNPH